MVGGFWLKWRVDSSGFIKSRNKELKEKWYLATLNKAQPLGKAQCAGLGLPALCLWEAPLRFGSHQGHEEWYYVSLQRKYQAQKYKAAALLRKPGL